MAGYNWSYGMSNNAVKAYRDGRVPKTKITNALLRKYGITLTSSEVRLAIRYGLIVSSEYHHTSKCFNLTYFYDLRDIKDREEEIKEGLDHVKKIERFSCIINNIAKQNNLKWDSPFTSCFHIYAESQEVAQSVVDQLRGSEMVDSLELIKGVRCYIVSLSVGGSNG